MHLLGIYFIIHPYDSHSKTSRSIFIRQERYMALCSHTTGVPQLPPRSILQNQGKSQDQSLGGLASHGGPVEIKSTHRYTGPSFHLRLLLLINRLYLVFHKTQKLYTKILSCLPTNDLHIQRHLETSQVVLHVYVGKNNVFSHNHQFFRSLDAEDSTQGQRNRDNVYVLETTEEQRRLYNLLRY